MSDVVAIWEVPLSDRIHKIEFEHGTTTGKRVVRVDGEEIIKREWMFKLVGSEVFFLQDGQAKFEILIGAANGFAYEYTLLVNGKQLTKFKEKQTKIMKTWMFQIDDQPFRVVLEKGTLDVWLNGNKMETRGEFAEDGTVINFELVGAEGHQTYIKTISSGNKKEGIIYSLILDDCEIPESFE